MARIEEAVLFFSSEAGVFKNIDLGEFSKWWGSAARCWMEAKVKNGQEAVIK